MARKIEGQEAFNIRDMAVSQIKGFKFQSMWRDGMTDAGVYVLSDGRVSSFHKDGWAGVYGMVWDSREEYDASANRPDTNPMTNERFKW